MIGEDHIEHKERQPADNVIDSGKPQEL